MNKNKTSFLLLIFAMLFQPALFAQETVPTGFKQDVQEEYNKQDHQEIPFGDYYQFKLDDYKRMQTTPRSAMAVPNNTTICGNGDFNSSLSTADWFGEYGSLNGANLPDFPNFSTGFQSGAINLATSRHTIVAAGTDPNVPINTTHTTTGNSMRIGNRINGRGSEMISKRFTVTAADALPVFWYATVLQDPSHSLEAQPSFWVRIVDHTAGGTVVPGLVNLGNGSDKIYANLSDPFFQTQGSIAYRDWACVQMNLSSLVGHNIEVNFISEDCGLGAHYGYTYIDDFCGSCDSSTTGNFGMNIKKSDTCGPGQICIDYQLPVAPNGTTGALSVVVKIYQNGALVGTLPGIGLVAGSTYCWPVTASFLAGLNQSAGGFDFVVHGDFILSGSTIGSMDVGVTPSGIEPGLNNDYELNCGNCWLDDIKPTDYTVIPASISIIADQLWEGKYYIPDNVTVNIVGATLDLTNVDIIFGECAGIIFSKDAQVRANNSVFRPCDMNTTWLGFVFKDKASGVINESTFKNAQVALDFQDMDAVYVRVANNLFENCRVGIGSRSVNFMDGITGNTFNVDRNEVNYKVSCQNPYGKPVISGATYAQDHWGILAIKTQFFGNISQNDFVNVQESKGSGTGKKYYGISLTEGSGGTVSDNNFTDLYRSVDISKSSGANIDNNKMEVNSMDPRAAFVSEHQIRVSGSYSINVTSNAMLYAYKRQQSNVLWSSHSAIYFEGVLRSTITNNTIKGFESGIQLQKSTSLTVKENQLADMGYCGIHVNQGSYIDVMCNTINMEDDYKTTAYGIYYIVTNKNDPRVRFSGNCIFEASTAILVEGVTGSCTFLPVISNNFLYNYTQYGVDGRYVQGSIGTAGSAINGGRNTFASNNTGLGAIDIRSISCPITTDGNFGVLSTSGPVTVGKNQYYSTASCGTQVSEDYDRLKKNYNETCDPKFAPEGNAIEGIAGNYNLTGGYVLELAKVDGIDTKVSNWFVALNTNDTDKEMDELYQTLISGSYELDEAVVSYFYYFHKGDYEKATGYLANIQLDLHEDWYTLENIKLNLVKEAKVLTADDTQVIEALESLVDDRAVYYEANQMLQLAVAGHDFPFIAIPKVAVIENTNVKTLDKNRVLVYPNPTNSELNVNYFFNTDGPATIKVVDLLGKVLMSQNVNNQSGYLSFDVSDIKEGVYIVEIVDYSGARETIRFIKM
jgi:hypothetical protein